MTADQELLEKIFFRSIVNKRAKLNGKRFVHYTTAEAAASIIRNKEVWMRSASCMNDYTEVQHGLACLQKAYNGRNGARLKNLLENLFPGFCQEFEQRFDSSQNAMRFGTYLMCVSEHEDREDALGRLSMWRAYGRDSGVALVMNSDSFLGRSDALKAYSVPVNYQDADGFELEFQTLVDDIAGNAGILKKLPRDDMKDYLFRAFLFRCYCTKHPGYIEEKEYRVIHCSAIYPSIRLIKSVEAINGAPQIIYKIPLKNIPEEGLSGIELPELLDRVIIGPNNYPAATCFAFMELLQAAGVRDANKRVFVSQIPLRH